MMNVLESMWRGDIALPDSACRQNNETKELGRLIDRHYQDLCNTLTDKQKETLEKYIGCVTELNAEENKNIFVYAFSLGVKLTAECFEVAGQ